MKLGMEGEKVDRKCDLDPFPSKKLLNTLQDCKSWLTEQACGCLTATLEHDGLSVLSMRSSSLN